MGQPRYYSFRFGVLAVVVALAGRAAAVSVSDAAELGAALDDPAVAEIALAANITLEAAASFDVKGSKAIRGGGHYGVMRRGGGGGRALFVVVGSLELDGLAVAAGGAAAASGVANYCGSGGSTSSCAKQSEDKCPTKFQWDDDKVVAGACTWDGGSCFRGEACVDEDPPPTFSPTAAPTAPDEAPAPGGCVFVRAGGSLTARGVTFEDCAVDGGDGGAVYAANATALVVERSRFRGCSASGRGGAIYADGVDVVVRNATFEDCRAAEGGAVAIGAGSLAIADASFDKCVAATGRGGGVAALAYEAEVDVARTAFYRCDAPDSDDGHGGGMFVGARLLTVAGCHFEGNDAGEHGAALAHAAPNGAASVVGTAFVRHGRAAAPRSRELVQFAELATVRLAALTVDDNDSGSRGLFVLSALSDVVVEDSVFSNNDVRVFRVYGLYTGRFHVDGCAFVNNVDNEGEGGAAIFIKETPATALVLRGTSFVNNTSVGAGSLGGAVWLSASARIDGCVFDGNSAAEGGALYLSIAVNHLTLTASTFTRNVADVGGAVAACATSGDWTFQGTVEIADLVAARNVARTADGVGEGKSGGGFANFKGGHLVVRNATLEGNTAAGAGSALAMQYVQASLYGVAAPGQTFALAKNVASRAYCEDVEYSEEVGGHGGYKLSFDARECSLCDPGTEWTGAPEYACESCAPGTYKNTSDAACTACPAGEYRDAPRALDCEVCVENRVPVPDGSACVECSPRPGMNLCALPGDAACACCAGYFENADGNCAVCPRAADCAAPGSTLATLKIEPKFYRTTYESTKLYRCHGDERACPGGPGAGDDLCADGYGGNLCAVCGSRRYPTTDGDGVLRCDRCRGRGSTALAYAVYALIFAAAIGGLLWLMLSESGREAWILMADTQGGAADDIVGALKETEAADEELETTTLSKRFGQHIGKVKAVAAFFQIVAAIPAVYGPELDLPWAYRGLQRVTEVFMLGFLDLVPTRCLTSVSPEAFYVRGLVATTLSPVVVLAILGLGFRLDRALKPPVGLDSRKNIYIEAYLLFMHLALPLLAITSVQSLVCDAYDRGDGRRDEETLRVAPAISCESDLWQGFVRPWGIVCTALYPVGVPLVYAILLYRARFDLNPTDKVPLLDVFASPGAAAATDRRPSLKRSPSSARTIVVDGEPLSPRKPALARSGSTRTFDASAAMSAATRALLIRREEYQESLMDARSAILERVSASDFNVPTSSFKFLWRDYEPRCYWWECLEVLRRVFFCSLLSAIDPGSKLQLALALFIAILYLCLYIQERPFVIEEDDMVAEVAAWGVVLTLFVCFLIRSMTSFHRAGLLPITTLLLFCAAALPLVAVVAILFPRIRGNGRALDEKRRPAGDGPAADAAADATPPPVLATPTKPLAPAPAPAKLIELKSQEWQDAATSFYGCFPDGGNSGGTSPPSERRRGAPQDSGLGAALGA